MDVKDIRNISTINEARPMITGSITSRTIRELTDSSQKAIRLVETALETNYETGFNDGKICGVMQALRLAGVSKEVAAAYTDKITGCGLDIATKATDHYWSQKDAAGESDEGSDYYINCVSRKNGKPYEGYVNANGSVTISDYGTEAETVVEYDNIVEAGKDYLLF